MTRVIESSSGSISGADITVFYSVAARITGTISVAHSLGKTPTVVLAVANKSAGDAIVLGTHDATDLVINNGSTGASVVLFAM